MRTINYYFRLLTTQAQRLHAKSLSVRITDGRCIVKFITNNNIAMTSRYHFSIKEMKRCAAHLIEQHSTELNGDHGQFAHEFSDGLIGTCIVSKSNTGQSLYIVLDKLSTKKEELKKLVGFYIPSDRKAVFHTKVKGRQ